MNEDGRTITGEEVTAMKVFYRFGFLTIALLVFSFLSLSSCKIDHKSSPDEKRHFLTLNSEENFLAGVGKVKITSQVGVATELPLESAQIIITKVQLRSKDHNGKFLTFPEGAISFGVLDLKDISQGISRILSRARIPTGEYDMIRLYTEENGEIRAQDGRHCPFRIPSGPTSGLKVFLDPPVKIESGKLVKIKLEFDLRKSFVIMGGGSFSWNDLSLVSGNSDSVRAEQGQSHCKGNGCEEKQDKSSDHPASPSSSSQNGQGAHQQASSDSDKRYCALFKPVIRASVQVINEATGAVSDQSQSQQPQNPSDPTQNTDAAAGSSDSLSGGSIPSDSPSGTDSGSTVGSTSGDSGQASTGSSGSDPANTDTVTTPPTEAPIDTTTGTSDPAPSSDPEFFPIIGI